MAIEDGTEHAGRVEPREAEPLDVAAGCDERGDLAIRQEPVVGDGRERRLPEVLTRQV
jgi:hypothetical protein